SSRRRHTRWPRDWSSDVCSSDLRAASRGRLGPDRRAAARDQADRERRLLVPQYDLVAEPVDHPEPTAAGASVVEPHPAAERVARSEERRVGKEGRWGGWAGSWRK